MKLIIIVQAICLLGSVTATTLEAAIHNYSVALVQPVNQAVLQSTAAQGCTFQAWSGSHCDGDAGNLDTLSSASGSLSRCINTQNRHSFIVGAGCPTGVTYLCEGTGCGCSYSYAHTGGSASCINVNLGTNWQSAQVLNVCIGFILPWL